MEEEKDLYYRLFIPLSNKQKEDVFDIWMDNIEEDIYLRKEEIEKYCKAKDCDFMRALLHIYDNIKSKYLCSYINNEINQNVHKYFDFESLGFFLRKRVVYSLNDGRSLNNEQRIFHKEMLDIIKEEGKYNFFIASKNGHSEFIDFGIDSISRLDVEVDEKDLDYQIKRIVEKRHVDNNKYINNITNVHKDEDQLNSLPKLEKLMYLPFNSIDIVIEDETKQREELKNFNKDGLKQFIVDFLFDELFLNNEKSIRGYPRKLFDDLSKEWTILKEQENEEKMLKNLNNKIFEIRTSNNYLFIQWQNANFPLLTTKCKEKKINVVLDLVLDIVRKDNNEVIYNSDNAISDYLNGGKQLINKNNKLEEIDLIEWLVHYYYINYNYYPGDTDIFKKNIDGVKKCIGDFMFLYIEYMLHTRFRFEYLLNKENEPTYNNEGSTQVVKKEQEKQKVEIDVDALKEYFKPQFKQQDVDSSNFDTLINDLRGGLSSYTKNEITAIASLIYISDKLLFAKKPATFNKWLKAFCSMINKDVPKSKPSGVKKQIGILSKTFYYL